MHRPNWYFRQRVTNPEMKQFTDFIEDADWTNVRELLGNGILTGGVVKERGTPDSQFVLVEQTIARDVFGRRVNVIDNFGDTVSSIVLGLTLQVDGISVPNTNGTYILFTGAPGVAPFNLVGQQIKLSRSENGPSNGLFTIQQVVTTDWGGLIPSQIMVRIDEELDEEGYESGLSPRGTSVIAEITSGTDSNANAAFDELNQDIRPVNPGNERWVSLYARFDRVMFDTRLDGNGQIIQYIQLEGFKYVVDATEAEAVLGTNNRPAKRTNGDLFLADIQHIQGSAIFNAQIDISRQDKMNNLPALAAQIIEYSQAIFHGPKVAWTGTNFQITGDAKLALPRKSFLYNIPQFDIPLSDGEVVYMIVNRNAVASEDCVAVKTTRGSVPEGTSDTLVFVLADRNGLKIQGPLAGEMEPGQESDIGDALGDAYLSFTGMSDENDANPTYTNARLAAAQNLEQADDILADDIDDLQDQIDDLGDDTDALLDLINSYFSQFKIAPHATDLNKAIILASDVTLPDGTILSQELESLIAKFDGAVINFTTGVILEDDEVTPLGVNFTPFSIPASEYFWYGIGVIAGIVQADNTITVQIQVTPALSSNASASLAPKPEIVGDKKLGAVLVQNNGGSIERSVIRQLGVGSGSGGGNAGPVALRSYGVEDMLFSESSRSIIALEVETKIYFKEVIVEVTEVFDGTPTFTVGTDADPDYLFMNSDIDLTKLGIYKIEVTEAIVADAEIKAFIGTPGTTGKLNAKVILSGE